jgi:hypothetical protein
MNLNILLKNSFIDINAGMGGINSFIHNHFTTYYLYFTIKYVLIPFLVIAIFSMILLLILNRYFSDQVSDQKDVVEEEINDFLTEIIFSNDTIINTREKINAFKKGEIYKNKWCKYHILDKLIHIKQNIKDINPNLILNIYRQFDLNKYSLKLIKNRKWYNKSLGFYHYTSLDYKIKKGYIKPYLNSKNRYLKSNALISLISLSDDKFNVLNNFKEKISTADEIKIIDIIYNKKSTIPVTIKSWLNNSNNSIVILAIKLIIRYRESFTNSQIKYLLFNVNVDIRREIILAVRELLIVDANDLLIDHYGVETDIKNKVSILKTLGIIGDHETKKFIISLLDKEADLDVKFEIVNAVNKIDKTFFNHFELRDESENEVLNKIILHVKNPYLN